MNPTIEKLLLQIAYICLHITTQGKWHAHYDLAAHVRGVTVWVQPADTDYQASPMARALKRTCYYQNRPNGIQRDEAELTASAIAELQDLLSDLEPFLAEEQVPEPSKSAALDTAPLVSTFLSDDSLAAIKRLALDGGTAELQLTTGVLDHSALLEVDRIDQPNGYGLAATLSTGKQRHSLSLGVHDGIYAARLCEWVETIAHGRLATAA